MGVRVCSTFRCLLESLVYMSLLTYSYKNKPNSRKVNCKNIYKTLAAICPENFCRDKLRLNVGIL